MTAHSHLGASGAERWLHCPGSVALVQRFGKPDDDDDDGDGPAYRWEGSVAHAAIADCLINDLEAWEVVGREYEGHVLTADLSAGVAFYLNVVLPMRTHKDTWLVQVEQHLAAPEIHPALFGTVDLAICTGDVLRIIDYKNGAGVSVDVEENPQEMYYAFLKLERMRRDDIAMFVRIKHVELTIVQPNDFNPAGKVRTWLTTPDHILDWGANTLVTTMCEVDKGLHPLDPGEHCRFCPARVICPAQQILFNALAAANPADAKQMTDDELNRYYALTAPARIFIKAIGDEAYARAMQGAEFASIKLVRKQADRIWKDEALQRFSTLYGTEAFTPPKFRSPADMEKLSQPGVKALVKELAYTPDTGLTLKLRTEKGVEVKVPKASSLLEKQP